MRLIGKTPGPEEAGLLLAAFEAHIREGIASSNEIGAILPAFSHLAASASGGLLVTLGARSDAILWIRGEVAEAVRWAGRPDASKHSFEGSLRLSPRKSFAVWEQIQHGLSAPWRAIEIEAALGLERIAKRALLAQLTLDLAKSHRSEFDRFHLLADLVPHLVWTTTQDGKLDYLNERWRSYAGMSTGVSLEQVWRDPIHPDDLNGHLERWELSVATGCDYEFELRIKHAVDGTYHWHLSRASPLKNDKGEIIQWIGTCTNIDDQRRVRNELEAQVVKRTKAGLRLQAVNKELEEFAYIASHDLKAPLRVIDNTSKWLEEDLAEHLTDDTRETMKLLRGRVKRMDRLLDDLLEYARIGRTPERPSAKAVAGDLLVNDVLALLPTSNFTFEVSSNFANIQLSRMPIQHILSNLIGNAIKHHDKPHGRIELTVQERGDFYEFGVRDDGPGIPVQFQDQIFKMFQTLRPRDQVEGSGMGLAMARKTVELFGGVLSIESAVGIGSIFRFTWPIEQQRKSEEGQSEVIGNE